MFTARAILVALRHRKRQVLQFIYDHLWKGCFQGMFNVLYAAKPFTI